mgnify:CR=1 FL=1
MKISKILALGILGRCSCKFNRREHFNRHHRRLGMTATGRGRPFFEPIDSAIDMAARRDYYATRLAKLMKNGKAKNVQFRRMLIQTILAKTAITQK